MSFKEGMKIITKKVVHSTSLPIGSIGRIKSKNTGTANAWNVLFSTNPNNYCVYELEMKACPLTVDDMKEEERELNDKLTEVREKIDFCIENKLKEYNDEVFRVWQIVKELKGNYKSDITKAEAIVEIINS